MYSFGLLIVAFDWQQFLFAFSIMVFLSITELVITALTGS